MSKLLKDYSGPFRPDAKLLDFSEETLKAWWYGVGGETAGIDGMWHTFTKNLYGEQKANELEREIWIRYTPLQAMPIAEALNVKMGNGNVADVFKAFQFDPYAGGVFTDVNYILDSYNDGIMEVLHCKPLEFFERSGYSDITIMWMCQVIDGVAIETYARVFNPRIRMEQICMPPRKPEEKKGICCKNRIVLDEPVSLRETGSRFNPGDYSGEFKRDRRFHEFSDDTMWRLFVSYGKQSMALDGVWYSLLKERFGQEKTLQLEKELWKIFTPRRVKWIRTPMNIQGNDVETVFKAWQFDPMGRGICPDAEMDLKNKNHGIITAKRCLPLEYCERHGYAPEVVEYLFRVIAAEAMENYAREFNPNIKTKFLFAPPRKPADKLALQIELKLEA